MVKESWYAVISVEEGRMTGQIKKKLNAGRLFNVLPCAWGIFLEVWQLRSIRGHTVCRKDRSLGDLV
jgi:hypothetical protein